MKQGSHIFLVKHNPANPVERVYLKCCRCAAAIDAEGSTQSCRVFGFVHSSIVGAAAEAAAVMPDSGRVSIAPLVASGTDSRSSKVKAYWGKTIPTVRETPTVPVGTPGASTRTVAIALQQPVPVPQNTRTLFMAAHVQHMQGTTHTLTHIRRLSKADTVLLTYLPAHAQPYIAAVLGSWNEWGSYATAEPESMGELMHIHKTLQTIQRRSNQRSQQRLHDKQQTDAAAMDTVALRAKVNASVANQIEFFTTIQSAWCNNGKEPGAISEDHIL